MVYAFLNLMLVSFKPHALLPRATGIDLTEGQERARARLDALKRRKVSALPKAKLTNRLSCREPARVEHGPVCEQRLRKHKDGISNTAMERLNFFVTNS